jgi:hypothetical protein
MRALVRDILARRMPEPPALFLAMQVSRLEEALLASFGATSGANNLQAGSRRQDCARARSLSRCRPGRALGPPRCVRSARGNPPCLKARIAARIRPQMAPQRLEKIESAPGNGMVPEAPDPQDMVQRRDAPRWLSPRRPKSSRGRGVAGQPESGAATRCSRAAPDG